MKLSQMLASVTWADVKASLLWNYPAVEDSIEAYRRVFLCLQDMEAAASNMRLIVREVIREGGDAKPSTEVTGRDGTRNRDLEDFDHFGQAPDSEFVNAETDYSLALTPWEQWLGMEIDLASMGTYTASQIVAHCLWEMTVYGFEPSQIQAERDELKRRVDELEAMTEEERKEGLIPWERVMKELEGEEPQ